MGHYITIVPEGTSIGGNPNYRMLLEDVFNCIFNMNVPEFVGCIRPFDLFDHGICMSKKGATAEQELARLQSSKVRLELFLEGLSKYRIPSEVSRLFTTPRSNAGQRIWLRDNFTLILDFMNAYLKCEGAYVEAS